MNKKTFFLGVVTGIVLTFVGLFVIGLVNQNSEENEPVQYFEKPVSYENKKETSFKVFQVLGKAALAKEASDIIGDNVMYFGNTVLLLGENYYSDQIITINNPQRVGTYSYTNKGGMPMTVPVIEGDMK
ncbi:MAG: VPDSG-CTERM exosortase interaction domain protein [Prevotella sp.]|nr:VPDSG-CTERM exosortase interaction domain protein [Prevotella sp.]